MNKPARGGLHTVRRWVIGSLLAVMATACPAARLALLVGVGAYPALPAELQLIAPANDVRLMRQVLIQRGFEEKNIEVLADGVEGARLPTFSAIASALQGLAKRAQPGDIVYLHFSGHGSLQGADMQKDAGTATGPGQVAWQPIFLPRDVRRWDGQPGTAVPNALTDTQLRQWVDDINEAGAFVFAVFDACHAAKLVRGANGVDRSVERPRQVPPGSLGVNAPAPATPPLPDWVAGASPAVSREKSGHRGQAVYFYAAQSVELAASLPLPQGDTQAWHGLFSWHVAQALALGQAMTYRQLGQHLLARYDQLPAAAATPLFSGDGLDRPVFGEQAPSVRQWPLAQRQGRLMMPAGALSGLAPGALLAVLSDPGAPAVDSPKPPQGTLGFVKLASVEVNRSQLDPVAWQGWSALDATLLPASGAWVRLMTNPPSFALRTAIERSECTADCLAGRALAKVQADGVFGVDLRLVGPADAADVRLRATDLGVQLLLPGSASAASTLLDNPRQAAGDAGRVTAMADQISTALRGVARTRNLLQLAARLSNPASPSTLHLTLELQARDTARDRPISAAQLVTAAPGDVVLLAGRNEGDDPVDVAAFWLGADQSVHQVYPDDARDSPRLAAGEPLRRIGLAIDAGSHGVERLLVITMPMQRGQEVTDFRFLEQGPMSRRRGATGPDLQSLFDACFADYRVRGAAAPALPPERLGMQLYTFQIVPP